jgi:hypothetical protein
MTILSVFEQVCPVIGLTVPDAVMASTDREHVELAALANEMASRIAKAHEWQLFNTIATYTGDGSTEDFELPSDYGRMLKKAQVWSSSLETPLSPISDRDRWLGLDIQSFDFVINAWILYGGQIHIKPALADAVTAKHWYQSNLIVAPEAGDNKTAFTADADTFRLDERLLRLGIIWQWKANKGLAYAEDMATYEEAKEKLICDDKGSRSIRMGAVRLARGARVAYPLTITP